jgi:hypothetical protein
MRDRIGKAIGRLSSAKQAKAAGEIDFRFGITAICSDFVIFGCTFDALFDTAAVLQAEAQIVCAVRMALVRCALIELRRKR